MTPQAPGEKWKKRDSDFRIVALVEEEMKRGVKRFENCEEIKSPPCSQQPSCLHSERNSEPSSNALDSTPLGTHAQQLCVGDGGNESGSSEHSSGTVPVTVNSAVYDPSIVSFQLVQQSPQSNGTTDGVSTGLDRTQDEPPTVSVMGTNYDYNHMHMKRLRKSYDIEFKLSAIDYYRSGHTRVATAKRFGVHRKRIHEWTNQESTLRKTPPTCTRLKRPSMDNDSTIHDHSPLDASTASLSPSLQSAYASIQTLTNVQIKSPVSLSTQQEDQGIPADAEEDGSYGSNNILNLSGSLLRAKPREPSSSSHFVVPSTESKRRNILLLQSLDENVISKILDAMNLSKYKERFFEEQVDGELLVSLGDVELKELGVDSSLHRLRLSKLINGCYSAEELLKKRFVNKSS